MTKVNRFLSIILIGCMIIGIWSNIFYPISPIVSVLVVGIVIGYFVVKKNIKRNSKVAGFVNNHAKDLTIMAFVLIIIVQFLVVTFFKASVYHDPFRVLYQADLLSHHDVNWNDSTYFNYCPNNIPLVYGLTEWLKLTHFLGISTNWSINLLCIFTVDFFIALVILIIKKITGNWKSCLKTICFFLLTPLAYTYLLQVFYSDIILLISVCGIWLAFICWSRSSLIKKTLISISIILCGLIGMLIKPSIIVLLISVGLTVLLFTFIKKKVNLIVPAIALIIGMGTAPIINQKIVNEVQFSVKSKYKLPVNTWIYMGLNNQTAGTYARNDINQIEKIPQNKRTHNTDILIHQRIKKLGIIGVLKQWVSKIEVCENVGTVQGAYMSGNYDAPTWFLRSQRIISQGASIIFRSLIIIIMIKIIKNCYFNNSKAAWLSFFTKLSILGFIAFYSILWETECRYGLILIPLYLIFNASSKLSDDFKGYNEIHTSQVIFNGLIFGFLTLNLFTPNVADNIDDFSGVVTAQNSQLSDYYKARSTTLDPHHTICEKVKLTNQANNFSMIVPQNSDVKVDLILPNNTTKHLTVKGGVAFYYGSLKPGMYQIQISNPTLQKQSCTIIAPPSYNLVSFKVTGDSKIKNGYFIYSFENRRS